MVSHTAFARLFAILTLALAGSVSLPALAAEQPAIALIIDDLGNRRAAGIRAVELPGPVACSFFPFGRYTHELAQRAHERSKEVMLHLPMQAVGTYQDAVESGMLTLDMTSQQYRETFLRDVAAVPYISGFNNHMGSMLTQHPGNMAWLMQVVRDDSKLFFIDSRTTTATVARQVADEYGIPASQRNVFLDNEENPAAIRKEFRRLVGIARKEGTAIAIGHPYPATLDMLNELLPRLDEYGVRLVPVAQIIEMQKTGKPVWQTYLSR